MIFFTVRKSWLISNLSLVSGGVAPIRSHAFSSGHGRPSASLLGMWLHCCPDGLPRPARWVTALRWWRSLRSLPPSLTCPQRSRLHVPRTDRDLCTLSGALAAHTLWEGVSFSRRPSTAGGSISPQEGPPRPHPPLAPQDHHRGLPPASRQEAPPLPLLSLPWEQSGYILSLPSQGSSIACRDQKPI